MTIGRALIAALATLPGLAFAQTDHAPPITAGTDEPLSVPDGYVRVWADEFDTPGLPDPKRWAYDTSRNQAGWYNEERQYYAAARPENVRVENGKLILTATAERLSDRADHGGQDYASGKIFTKGLPTGVMAMLRCGRSSPAGAASGPQSGCCHRMRPADGR